MRTPGGLVIAVVLQWVAAVVAFLEAARLIVAAIAMSDAAIESEVEQALVAQGIAHVSGSLVSVGVLLAGVVLLVLALARVVVSVYLLRGRNWARIVIALMVVLSIVAGVAYMFDDEVIRGVLTIAIEIVVVYLLFNSRTSAYIRERGRAAASDARVDEAPAAG